MVKKGTWKIDLPVELTYCGHRGKAGESYYRISPLDGEVIEHHIGPAHQTPDYDPNKIGADSSYTVCGVEGSKRIIYYRLCEACARKQGILW